MSDQKTEIHKHYYMWPNSDCGCFAVLGVVALAFMVVMLASMKALPWQ